MSNWTHVSGIARVDAYRVLGDDIDLRKHFGKETPMYPRFPEDRTDKESIDEYYRKMDILCAEIKNSYQNPDEYLPHGSEGTLHMSTWDNPDSCAAAYTVSVWGDLRDHEDPIAVTEWFREKCSKLSIRNAIIIAENEINGKSVWFHEE